MIVGKQFALFGPARAVRVRTPKPEEPVPLPEVNHDYDASKTDQLPMILTAREIMNNWQPFEGDRAERFDEQGHFQGVENAQQLYDRKLAESEAFGSHHGGRVGVTLEQNKFRFDQAIPVGLPDDFYTHEGQDKLTDETRGTEEDARPTLKDGHHRLAYVAKHAPDTLIPVRMSRDTAASRKQQLNNPKNPYNRVTW